MDFDRRRAELGRHFDLRGRRADKKRNADPGSLERADRRRQLRALADGVETAFGGAFGAPLRHEASGMRFGLESDANHFVGRRHFKIERLVDLGLQTRNVVVANVTAILAQMSRDTVATGGNCQLRAPARDPDDGRPARCGS